MKMKENGEHQWGRKDGKKGQVEMRRGNVGGYAPVKGTSN